MATLCAPSGKKRSGEQSQIAWACSKTSNNGCSEKRTTSVQRTAHLPPIAFTIELIHYEPSRSGHLNSEQRILISHRLNLANTKLPPKMGGEATPT